MIQRFIILQNYQTALKNYPIKEYNQKYKLLPIETYRLHGLTGSDFLQNEIPIWNYGAWVKDVKKVLTSDISKIRKDIDAADDLLNKNTNLLLTANEFKDDFELNGIDARLKFKIGKFDHKSLLLHLFNYKESKLGFLELTKKPLNNPNDSLSNYLAIQKARFYENLVNKKLACDSLNKNIVSNLNSYDLNKYNEFFTNKYGGEAGLKNYSNNEAGLLNKQLEMSLNNYKYFLISGKRNNYDSIEYKTQKLYLKKTTPDFENAQSGVYYTVDYVKSGHDYYITGYTSIKGKSQAFVAKTSRLSDIKWIKIITTQDNSTGSNIKEKGLGCELLVNEFNGSEFTNELYSFDDLGKQKDKIEFGLGGYPRYFSFDDINQQYLLILKGNKPNSISCLAEPLIFAKFGADKKELVWQTTLNIKGQFVEIIKLNQEYYLFSNFTEYSTDSTKLASKAGATPLSTNLLINVIDEDGASVREKTVLNNGAFFAIDAIKLSNKSINVVGLKSELIDLNNAEEYGEKEFLYLLLNSNGEIYFDNWK
ncbi:MAG: hypothetical protein HC831_26090 [Chloroflexia bacterium]|nr:hypothetical protein [Chloroflexia bacterium]